MALALVALEIDARDPVSLAAFWGVILGRSGDPSRERLPATADTDFELVFVPSQAPRAGLHRMHPDLTSASAKDQAHTVDTALRLGGRHIDVGQRGDEGHVVLADPEGNEFCVIEPGSGFLADTARIGALAGDGMAEVGYFWSRLLDWPLVWDQDGETAVQSPLGGTKITWGGPPVSPKRGRNRLRWVLATAESIDDEVERMSAMGATLLSRDGDRAELGDPEGNEFILVRAR